MAKVVKKAAEPQADLEALQNEGEFVTAGGSRIQVKPYNFSQLLKAVKHLSKIGSSLSTGEPITDAFLIMALGDHADEVLELIKLSTGKDDDFFQNLSSDEGIELALATWRVNKDFFVQRIAPKLKDLGLFPDSQQDQKNSDEESQPE